MTASRRERIVRMLEDDPADVFLRYSLALEMEAAGEWQEARGLLEDLARGPDAYVPAFQMAAQHLVARGRFDEARDLLRDGIEQARRQGNSHAAGEMAELLMTIGDAGEAGPADRVR